MTQSCHLLTTWGGHAPGTSPAELVREQLDMQLACN